VPGRSDPRGIEAFGAYQLFDRRGVQANAPQRKALPELASKAYRRHSALEFPFLQEKCHEKILRLGFIMDFSPAIEGGLHGLDLFQHICPSPFARCIIIGDLTLLIHLLECIRDRVDMLEDSKGDDLRVVGW
jgi:hypothetical protein